MDTNALAMVQALHQLYCQLTAQRLTLRFDRERLWYEFLRAGFSTEDLKVVVRYLQKEIRADRRNIGSLKLSNLLQLDRFEEDLNISRVKLHNDSAPRSRHPSPFGPPLPTPEEQQHLRQKAKAAFEHLRQHLRDS